MRCRKDAPEIADQQCMLAYPDACSRNPCSRLAPFELTLLQVFLAGGNIARTIVWREE